MFDMLPKRRTIQIRNCRHNKHACLGSQLALALVLLFIVQYCLRIFVLLGI